MKFGRKEKIVPNNNVMSCNERKEKLNKKEINFQNEKK